MVDFRNCQIDTESGGDQSVVFLAAGNQRVTVSGTIELQRFSRFDELDPFVRIERISPEGRRIILADQAFDLPPGTHNIELPFTTTGEEMGDAGDRAQIRVAIRPTRSNGEPSTFTAFDCGIIEVQQLSEPDASLMGLSCSTRRQQTELGSSVILEATVSNPFQRDVRTTVKWTVGETGSVLATQSATIPANLADQVQASATIEESDLPHALSPGESEVVTVDPAFQSLSFAQQQSDLVPLTRR